MAKDKTESLNCEYISPIEVEDMQDAVTNREDFKTGLGQTIHVKEDQGVDKIIKVGQDMILILGVIMETIWEVIRGMGDKNIMIIEVELLEIKAMKESGVDHMIGKAEVITEEIIEALVIVGLGQVQEQVQIVIGLDGLSADIMTLSQETAQPHNQTER